MTEPSSRREPERVVDSVVATLGEMDELGALRAQTLRNFAIMVDRGCRSPTGAAMPAGVHANIQLKLMLAKLGQDSGFTDLVKALLDD